MPPPPKSKDPTNVDLLKELRKICEKFAQLIAPSSVKQSAAKQGKRKIFNSLKREKSGVSPKRSPPRTISAETSRCSSPRVKSGESPRHLPHKRYKGGNRQQRGLKPKVNEKSCSWWRPQRTSGSECGAKRQAPRKALKCWNCGLLGHTYRTCPKCPGNGKGLA